MTTTEKPALNLPLLLALVILTLRLTTINSIGASTISPAEDARAEFYSVLLNFLLLLPAAALLFDALKQRLKAGAAFFCAVGFAVLCWLPCLYASEKRYAIDAALTISAALSLFLLIRRDASPARTIALCLMFMMGFCAVNTLESVNQLTRSNDYLLQQYEADPAPQLEALGIEPGSLEQFMYEHRLYSKDVKGFFTNGNSLGSFALLCFFPALAMLTSALKNKTAPLAAKLVAAGSVVMCAVLLILAASKGTIMGFCAGLAVYLALSFAPKPLKKFVLPAFAVAAALGLCALLIFAAQNAELPGGDSMLVRGEYWHSTLQMIRDNGFGIGGDNFRFLYPLYKLPAAMETVTDPHCFPLSIASQYGLPALAAFLALIILSMKQDKNEIQSLAPAKPSIAPAAVAALAMLLLRPALLPIPQADSAGVQAYIYITMYLMPAIVFFGWCLFTGNRLLALISLDGLPVALRASLAAFLTHNLIDLAIFEPGNMLLFFAMLGLLELAKMQSTAPCKAAAKISALVPVGICAAAFFLAVLPCGRLSAAIDKVQLGGYGIIDRLADSDKYSSTAASIAARLSVQMQRAGGTDLLLEKAKRLYEQEASRNPKSFKPYSSLGKLAEIRSNLAQAAAYYEQAIERYPGKSSLYVSLGRCLEAAGKRDEAIANYKTALEIEKQFEEKFRRMYPDEKPVSRLTSGELRTIQSALSHKE